MAAGWVFEAEFDYSGRRREFSRLVAVVTGTRRCWRRATRPAGPGTVSTRPCKRCDGSGAEPLAGMEGPCSRCQGQGTVQVVRTGS